MEILCNLTSSQVMHILFSKGARQEVGGLEVGGLDVHFFNGKLLYKIFAAGIT